MSISLVNFMNQNQLSAQGESFTSRLKREFKSINSVLSPDYVINLQEKGLFTEEHDRILELFMLFRSLSVYQAANFLLPQYSDDIHAVIAKSFAELYFLHFIQPIDIEDKLLANTNVYPLPSLTFILGPAGARYLASKHGVALSEIGWSKANMINNQSSGTHNLYVSEIIIRFAHYLRSLQRIPNIGIDMDIESEWNGRIFPRNIPKRKVLVRPDYTFRLRYQDENGNNANRTFFLEYDNGTESMEVVARKLVDYHLAFTGGSFVLGTPATSYIVFIFNDSKRATRFMKSIYALRKENLAALKKIYISTLDIIYPEGFFTDQYMAVDTVALYEAQRAKTKGIASSEEQPLTWYAKESPFPEIFEKVVRHNISEETRAAFEDHKLPDPRHYLKLEFDVFNSIKKSVDKPDIADIE